MMKPKRKLAIAPLIDADGVPHCPRSVECSSFTRGWFCAHDGEDPGLLCKPAIREMAAKLRSAFERDAAPAAPPTVDESAPHKHAPVHTRQTQRNGRIQECACGAGRGEYRGEWTEWIGGEPT